MKIINKILCICLAAILFFSAPMCVLDVSAASKLTEQQKKDKFAEINNWIIGDIWNAGYCDLYHYAEDGKNNEGKKMNVEYSIKKFKKAYKKLGKYDRFIKSLKGKKYSALKDAWKEFKKESKSLNKTMNSLDWSDAPFEEDVFNTDLINTYIMDIYDQLTSLSY